MTNEAALDRHLDDARCADLVLGLPAPADAERDLAHAASCPACEARLRAHAAAHDRARALPRRDARVLRPAVPWWKSTRGAGLAAAAAVAVALGVPFVAQHAARHDGAFTWLPAGSGVVQRATGSDPHLVAGLEAYARHDAEAAERELSAARATGSAEAARRVFLASAVLARGDAERAIGLLESVNFDQDLPEPWRGEALRTLAQAWRRAGRAGQADSLERALGAREAGERP
jgi:hypothetical protein